MVSVFFIILVAVFGTIAYFTEPSDTEKRIQERLSGLDQLVSQGDDDQTLDRQTNHLQQDHLARPISSRVPAGAHASNIP